MLLIFLAAIDTFYSLSWLMFLILVPLWLFVLLMNGDRKQVLKHIHVSEAECIRRNIPAISRHTRGMCLTRVRYTKLKNRIGSGFSFFNAILKPHQENSFEGILHLT